MSNESNALSRNSMEQAVQPVGRHEDSHGDLDALIQKGRNLRASRLWDDAAQVYLDALQHPQLSQAMMSEIGRVLFKAGLYKEALIPLSRAILTDPQDQKSARRLAIAVQQTEEPGAELPAVPAPVPTLVSTPVPDPTPVPSELAQVSSADLPALYRPALDYLMTGQGADASLPMSTTDMEKVVAINVLQSEYPDIVTDKLYDTLDDLLVDLIDNIPDDIIIIYAVANSGSDQLRVSVTDRRDKNQRRDFIFAFHQHFSRRVRRVESKIRKACTLKYILGMSDRLSRRVKVVTMVRDPMSRFYSAYMYRSIQDGRFDELDGVDLSTLGDDFWQGLNAEFVNTVRKGVREDFFDDELSKMTGIPVTPDTVDMSRGYSILTKGQIDLLILRTETMERLFPQAAAAFFGEEFHLLPMSDNRVNRTRMRDRPIYRECRPRMKVPAAILDAVYQKSWVLALFSPEEIAKGRTSWIVDPDAA